MNQGASEGVRAVAAATATAATRYEVSMGVMNKSEASTRDRQMSMSRYGVWGAQRTNKHEVSAGITNKSESIQTNNRDGTNKGEQVQGEGHKASV